MVSAETRYKRKRKREKKCKGQDRAQWPGDFECMPSGKQNKRARIPMGSHTPEWPADHKHFPPQVFSLGLTSLYRYNMLSYSPWELNNDNSRSNNNSNNNNNNNSNDAPLLSWRGLTLVTEENLHLLNTLGARFTRNRSFLISSNEFCRLGKIICGILLTVLINYFSSSWLRRWLHAKIRSIVARHSVSSPEIQPRQRKMRII